MRGKELLAADDLQTLRITPACAGKRLSRWLSLRPRRDHPRVCGEKLRIVEVGRVKEGSPPRMRGKVCTAEHDERQPGITPACAGKSFRVQHHLHPVAGITPACAGKSGAYFGYPRFHGDHPRVCGEKLHMRSMPCWYVGSPPRMRGKVSAGKILLHDGGITPAYAGKRAFESGLHLRPQDHPRVCGEKQIPHHHLS